MTDAANERVPPGFPPPPPLSAMPPPVPGTGASSQHQYPPPPVGRTKQEYYPPADKSVGVAYLLCLFFGWFGVHQFYLGKVGRGLGYLLTFAWFTVGWWVDLFTLPAQVKRVNLDRRMGLR